MAHFSKRDYEIVATILRRSDISDTDRARLTNAFMDVFIADNPAFIGPKFIDAVFQGPETPQERKIREKSIRSLGRAVRQYDRPVKVRTHRRRRV